MKNAACTFLFILMALTFALAAPCFAVEGAPGRETMLKEFSDIKTRLAGLEAGQQDVLSQKDKILKEIDRVRIWVRHSGGKPK